MPRAFATDTHCANGHPKTPENTYTYPGEKQKPVCKVCRMNSQRKYKGLPPLERNSVGKWNRHKTDCPQGHSYELFGRTKNTGARYCTICRRASTIRSSYGLSPEDWDSLVVGQEGRCAICTDASGELHVDHDRVSGAVRGLLCTNCNNGLGRFLDDTDRLKSAISYLQQS